MIHSAQDIFDGAADRLITTGGFLKREEVRVGPGLLMQAAMSWAVPDFSCLQTMVLCESVTSVEQAFKVLELMVKHQENKAILGGEVDDCKCPTQSKFMTHD